MSYKDKSYYFDKVTEHSDSLIIKSLYHWFGRDEMKGFGDFLNSEEE